MALSLLLGRASADHELALLQQIRALRQRDEQAQIFYIVPNHIKFETEIKVLERLAELDQRHGSALVTPNVQVFSLSRLAWYYMQDDPIYRKSTMSENGLTMLVQWLLNQHQDELKQYGGLLNKQGFITQFTKQLLELQQAGLSWTDVAKLAEQVDGVVLQNKLHDLAVIGAALQVELQNRDQYLSSELLTALKLYLNTARADVAHHYFFIQGYSQLTPGEKGVVETLMLNAGGVSIALPTDDGAQGIVSTELGEDDLFFKPKLLARQLNQFAQANEVAVKINTIEEQRELSSTYHTVEDFWIDYSQRGIRNGRDYGATDQLAIWQLTSRYQEVEQMARHIRQSVATGKARYRDYLLLTRDLGQYENILPAVFARYELPFFMDLDRPMLTHPLVAFVKQLLQLAPNYINTDIMALLKTELLIPTDVSVAEYREALALTENFVLAKNYQKGHWLSATAWQYDYRVTESDDEAIRQRASERDGQLALIHQQIERIVAPFLKRLEAAKDGQTMATLLYEFLANQGVEQRILAWRDEALVRGDLWAAQQPEQVWRTLMGLLDDFVGAFGSEQLALADFSAIIAAAFEGANYAGIPATMDQVRISESGIIQRSGYPVVMIFGATSANLPATTTQRALLQDADRLRLAQYLPEQVQLRDTAMVTMATEDMLMYNAMMVGSKEMYWLYATSDGTSAQTASSYVLRLQKQFNIPVQVFDAQPSQDDSAKQVGNWVGSVKATIANLVLVQRIANQEEQPLSEAWQRVFKLVNQQAPTRLQRVMAALQYQNQPEQVQSALLTHLFGDNLRTSISRLESYARNPYEFYLQYVLRLQPRQVLELTPAEKGTLLHALLERVVREVIANGQNLGQLSDDKIADYTEAALNDTLALDDPTFDIFKATPRMQFITQQLRDQVKLSLMQMRSGQQAGMGIYPGGIEAGFGISGSAGTERMQPVTYDLPHGKVTVRGKVDRYDLAGTDDLLVVDYKSSKRTFDYKKVLAGLELQLLTYWQAMSLEVNLPGKQVDAALFWNLKPELIKLSKIGFQPFTELQKQADILSKQQGEYRGLILDNERFIEHLEAGEQPKPFQIKRKKDGSFAQTSDVVDEQTLDLLLEFAEAKTREIAQAIMQGKFPLLPYRQGTQNGLTYSDYKAIMRFDALLGDHYNELVNKLKPSEALAAMQELINQLKGDEN